MTESKGTASRIHCIMCAVRELTVGTPKVTVFTREGQSITGAVIALGTKETPYGKTVPTVDLWLGGIERTRVIGYSTTLGEGILKSAPAVGDTLTIRYHGRKPIMFAGSARQYQDFAVTVKRSHEHNVTPESEKDRPEERFCGEDRAHSPHHWTAGDEEGSPDRWCTGRTWDEVSYHALNV